MTEKEQIKTQKNELRLRMKILRGNDGSNAIKDALLLENCLRAIDALYPERAGAGIKRKFFIYLSFSSEAPTDKLIKTLLDKGDKIYCPRVNNKEMFAVEYKDKFSVSRYGVLEPIGEAYEGEIDCIVTPLLAVDLKGNRLGFGGGFYDRFFACNPKAKRIAYCYDFQVLEEIPLEPFDEKVDCIVTDKRIIYINER